MSLQKDKSGRRYIQVEVEVPGTPEQVWEAIATGPGISSWFVPAEMESGKDGRPERMVLHFGAGMDSAATVMAWDPPRKFAAESSIMGPGSPAMATEWTVEARSGGTCIVRVVHSLFATNDDWDNQLESVESGWPAYFHLLRMKLTHFPGQPGAGIHLLGMSTHPEELAWSTLAGALNLAGAAKGERRSASPDAAPPFAGTVERSGEAKHPHQLLLRLHEPAPGTAMVCAVNCGGPVMAAVSLYLFGDRAAAIVDRDGPLWQAWMLKHFPPMGESASTAAGN